MDILVTRNSAIGHYNDRVQHTYITFNENHSDLPKFMNNYNENYRAIKPFFTKCYNDALEVIQKRFVNEGLNHHHSVHISLTTAIANQPSSATAPKPKYTANSRGKCRLTCQNCQRTYRSQVKLLRHSKESGNKDCYLKVLRDAVKNGRLKHRIHATHCR